MARLCGELWQVLVVPVSDEGAARVLPVRAVAGGVCSPVSLFQVRVLHGCCQGELWQVASVPVSGEGTARVMPERAMTGGVCTCFR